MNRTAVTIGVIVATAALFAGAEWVSQPTPRQPEPASPQPDLSAHMASVMADVKSGKYKAPLQSEQTTDGTSFTYRWMKPREYHCSDGDSCFGMEIVSSVDCFDSFYAAITLLDKNGNNIGWTNDTAQGVRAGEKTRLVFSTYRENVESARLGETHCHNS